MKILITGVGGPTPRSFAIALKKFGLYKDCEIVATDSNPLAVGLYQRELFIKSYVVPYANAPGYWERIDEIVKTNAIDYAVILPEKEVIEWSKRNEQGLLPCKALLPASSMAEILVDKSRMTEVLESLNVVPKSISFTRGSEDLESVGKKLGYPFWVRSASGTSGLGSLKIENRESLANWIRINPAVETFLASEFLPGRNLACKLLYAEGRLLRAACAERVNYIMAKVAPSGITGNTSFGRLLNEPNLVEVASQAMDHLFAYCNAKQHGFFTVDFKEDQQGKPLITEINVRHVAFTQCLAAGGANLPEDTIRVLDNDPKFDRKFHVYQFEEGTIFLRDVDVLPVLLKEKDLLRG